MITKNKLLGEYIMWSIMLIEDPKSFSEVLEHFVVSALNILKDSIPLRIGERGELPLLEPD